MKHAFAVALAALFADNAIASPLLEARQVLLTSPPLHSPPLTAPKQGSGAGPYAPGTYKTDNSLSGHTIYYPTKSTGTEKWPVLVWGNGACSTDGRSNSALLQNIASYGFLAIAEGGPNGGGTSNKDTMRAAIDWVTKTAGTGAYANVDASKIMAAGFSCGGVEAMDNIWDSRVDTVGVISSGLLNNQTAAKDWRKPVLFVLGGSGDIAYANVSISPNFQITSSLNGEYR